MGAAILLALAATVFQPPLAHDLRYIVVDSFPGAEPARLVRRETLRFAATPAGYAATVTLVSQSVEASPARREALRRLLSSLVGVPTTVAVDREGAAGAPIDPEPAWSAFVASRRALLARFDATPQVSAGPLAAGRAAIAAEIDPVHRDDRLREPLLALLPPRLAGLRPGEARLFTGMIATPAGPAAATGEIVLVAEGAALRRYRLVLRTAAGVGEAAAARLRASLPADAPPQARTRLLSAAAALAGAAFAETSELAVARADGLLATAHILRETVAADGTRRPIAVRDIRLDP